MVGYKPYALKQGKTKTDIYGKQTQAFTKSNGSRFPLNILFYPRDKNKYHPTQKPVPLLKKLIEIFTDKGDVVIDPCAGSGSTLIAALELDRKAFGFEIKKDFHSKATELLNQTIQRKKDIEEFGFAKTEIEKINPTLF